MGKSKKVFGDVNLTWTKVIVFAIISGIYTTIMNSKRYFFFGYNSYFWSLDFIIILVWKQYQFY